MLSKVGLFFDSNNDRDKYDLSEKLVWLLGKPTIISNIAIKTNLKFHVIRNLILIGQMQNLLN